MPDVITLGTFDLPHPGHVALLRKCRELAGPLGYVTAAVSSDAFVQQWKHKAPVMTCGQRMDVIGAIRYVDHVVENDGFDQAGLIADAHPDIVAVGADWATRDYHAQLGINAAWLAELGIEIVYVTHEHSDTVSTSLLRARMEAA